MVKALEHNTINDLALVRAATNVLTGLNEWNEPNKSRKSEVIKLLNLMQMDLEGRKIPVTFNEQIS